MDDEHPVGGSRVLIELIDKHADEIVGDLLQYYDVDVRDLFREVSPFTPKYILSLVMQLPLGSAFVAELNVAVHSSVDGTMRCMRRLLSSTR